MRMNLLRTITSTWHSLWTGLVSLIVLLVAFSARGLQTVYSFQFGPRNPEAGLAIGIDGNIYGTTYGGGNGGYGTAFEIATNGSLIYVSSFEYTNGAFPIAALACDPGNDTKLFGTTYQGGAYDLGSVFGITTNGTITEFTSFDGTNGAYPYAGLVSDGQGNWYGTTYTGGTNAAGQFPGYGTIFRISPTGVLTTILSFNFYEGANPKGALVLGSDGNFYGTATTGGTANYGTIFKVTPGGLLTNSVSFTFANGSVPMGSLIQDTNLPGAPFYGTTSSGGASSNGTIFVMGTDGDLRTIFSFDGLNGADPTAGLVLGNDGNFYGTTFGGGADGYGTIFRISPTGVMTTLISFNYANGANP